MMKQNDVYTDYEGFGYYNEPEPGDAARDNYILQNWVFHHNPFTKTWAAIPRELYIEYWSNHTLKGIIRSNSIETLIDILYRTEGDEKKIAKLVSE